MESKMNDFIYLLHCVHCNSNRFFEMRTTNPPAKVTCLRCEKRLSFKTKKGGLNYQVIKKKITKETYHKIQDKGNLMKQLISKQ